MCIVNNKNCALEIYVKLYKHEQIQSQFCVYNLSVYCTEKRLVLEVIKSNVQILYGVFICVCVCVCQICQCFCIVFLKMNRNEVICFQTKFVILTLSMHNAAKKNNHIHNICLFHLIFLPFFHFFTPNGMHIRSEK